MRKRKCRRKGVRWDLEGEALIIQPGGGGGYIVDMRKRKCQREGVRWDLEGEALVMQPSGGIGYIVEERVGVEKKSGDVRKWRTGGVRWDMELCGTNLELLECG